MLSAFDAFPNATHAVNTRYARCVTTRLLQHMPYHVLLQVHESLHKPATVLPNVLWHLVFSFVHVRARLSQCTRVCKLFQTVLKDVRVNHPIKYEFATRILDQFGRKALQQATIVGYRTGMDLRLALRDGITEATHMKPYSLTEQQLPNLRKLTTDRLASVELLASPNTLEDLVLTGQTLDAQLVARILRMFPKLTTLCIDLDHLFVNPTPNVLKDSFGGIRHFDILCNDVTLPYLSFNNLESLRLDSCGMTLWCAQEVSAFRHLHTLKLVEPQDDMRLDSDMLPVLRTLELCYYQAQSSETMMVRISNWQCPVWEYVVRHVDDEEEEGCSPYNLVTAFELVLSDCPLLSTCENLDISFDTRWISGCVEERVVKFLSAALGACTRLRVVDFSAFENHRRVNRVCWLRLLQIRTLHVLRMNSAFDLMSDDISRARAPLEVLGLSRWWYAEQLQWLTCIRTLKRVLLYGSEWIITEYAHPLCTAQVENVTI